MGGLAVRQHVIVRPSVYMAMPMTRGMRYKA